MEMTFAMKLAMSLFGFVFAIIIGVVGVVFVLPTETTQSKDPASVARRISLDIDMPLGCLEFVGGKFRREAIMIFRLSNIAISFDKFLAFSVPRQRQDISRRILDAAHDCGVKIVPPINGDMLIFRGLDYFVVYLNSNNALYLVYFGAQ